MYSEWAISGVAPAAARKHIRLSKRASRVRAVIPEEQTMAFEYVADDMGRAVDMAITKQGLPADAAYNLS